MRLRILAAAFAVLATTLAATSARADSFVYDAGDSSTGFYAYDMDLTSGLAIPAGETITFSGLAGVTGASTEYSNSFDISYTSTSVTYTSNGVNYTGPGDYGDVFTIDSTAPLGAISYTSTTNPVVSGATEGPTAPTIAPTPEPSSIALLSTGLLGIAATLRKRLA